MYSERAGISVYSERAGISVYSERAGISVRLTCTGWMCVVDNSLWSWWDKWRGSLALLV